MEVLLDQAIQTGGPRAACGPITYLMRHAAASKFDARFKSGQNLVSKILLVWHRDVVIKKCSQMGMFNRQVSQSIHSHYNALHLSDIFPEENAIIKTIQTSSGAHFFLFIQWRKESFLQNFPFAAIVRIWIFLL